MSHWAANVVPQARAGVLGFAVVFVVALAKGWLPAGSSALEAAELGRMLEEAKCVNATAEEPAAGMPIYISLPIIVVLVMASGLFSGLTLGLMGLDLVGLQIVERGGSEALAQCARKIQPVRANGNLLLCTLLLGNVAVNSALAIVSGDIFSGLVGFILSTAIIVIFGEIIPQASCARYALQVGYYTVPIVKVLMVILYPLTKPMSMALDCLLGDEAGTVYTRKEMLEMMKIQIKMGAMSDEEGQAATVIAEGAMAFRDKKAEDVMTPVEDVYMLQQDTVLNFDKIREIFNTGFSRIPVFGKSRHDYVGLLHTKDLMLGDPDDEKILINFVKVFNRKVLLFEKDTTLVEALNSLKKGETHIGLIRSSETQIAGVLTLEDIMEEILQSEIIDETDVYADVDKQIKVGDGRSKENLDVEPLRNGSVSAALGAQKKPVKTQSGRVIGMPSSE